MDLRYLPTTFRGKMDHVLEEAAEVTKAILKGRRFGWAPHTIHFTDGRPSLEVDNYTKLKEEIKDLRTALSRAEIALDAEHDAGTLPDGPDDAS